MLVICVLFSLPKICKQRTIKSFAIKLQYEVSTGNIIVIMSLHSQELYEKHFYVLILVLFTYRCSARSIPICSYCINYCSLPLVSQSQFSLLKIPTVAVRNPSWYKAHQLAIQKAWWLCPWDHWGQIHSVVQVGDLNLGHHHLNPECNHCTTLSPCNSGMLTLIHIL